MDMFKKVCQSLATESKLLDLKSLPIGTVIFVDKIEHRMVRKFNSPDEMEDGFLVLANNCENFFLPGRTKSLIQHAFKNGSIDLFQNLTMIYGGQRNMQHIFFMAHSFAEAEEQFQLDQKKVHQLSETSNETATISTTAAANKIDLHSNK